MPPTLPLTCRRSFVPALLLVTALTARAGAGTQQLAFEVATVRPSEPGATRGGILPTPGGRFTAIALTVHELIAIAYGPLFDDQIVGGPDWMRTDRFDITAVERSDATPSSDVNARILQMLRDLLADRFKLRIHEEMRELPVMALLVDRADRRLGPQLRPTATDCPALAASDPMRACGFRLTGPGLITGEGLEIGSFANGLSRRPGVERVVIDRTGLTGRYDIELRFSQDPNTPTSSAPSLFTALREQLGLRLDADRASVRVVIIDAVEGPGPN